MNRGVFWYESESVFLCFINVFFIIIILEKYAIQRILNVFNFVLLVPWYWYVLHWVVYTKFFQVNIYDKRALLKCQECNTIYILNRHVNHSWIKCGWNGSSHSWSIGWRQGAGKLFWILKDFFPENEVLECAYYFFCINKFT